MNWTKRTAAIVCFAAIGVAQPIEPALAGPGAEFFDGKKITYIVATKPGGGYDTYARLIAKYLEKHLPGARVIVKNRPGAGHIVGANQLFAAKPDGLTIGTFNTGLVYAQLLEREGIRFDLRKMSWIGKAAADPRVLVVGKDSGFATFDDLRRAERPILLASSGIASAAHNETILLAHALGLDVKVIPGHGGNEGEMAIMRKEIAGTFGSYSSLRPFVENGFGVVIFHVGGGPALAASVPAVRDLVHDDEGRAIAALIESQTALGRLTAAPPGVPAERLAALRAAYESALEDPDLRRDAARLRIPIVPSYGEDVAAKVDAALNQPPAIVALLAAVMNVEIATISVRTALVTVAAKGKKITFRSRDQIIEAKVSGSRTRVTIAGQDDDRANLKEGMVCVIEYMPGGEATEIDCDG